MINLKEHKNYSPFNVDGQLFIKNKLTFEQFYKKFNQLSQKSKDLMTDLSTSEFVKKNND